MNDGGDTVVDYAVEIYDAEDAAFTEVATGITSTSYSQSSLMAG